MFSNKRSFGEIRPFHVARIDTARALESEIHWLPFVTGAFQPFGIRISSGRISEFPYTCYVSWTYVFIMGVTHPIQVRTSLRQTSVYCSMPLQQLFLEIP